MKKMLVLIAVLFASIAFGTSAMAAEKSKTMTMTMDGYVIDTQCADANKDKLADFVKTHTKECAMLPPCHSSGYNLYSGGKLYKFDKESSDKVYDFLSKADSDLKVKVEVQHEKGGTLKLVSIKNAK